MISVFFAVFGGWHNQYAMIRQCKECGHREDLRTSTPDILSGTEYRTFKISFATNVVQVWKFGESDPFMTYNQRSYNVSYIGILTYWGAVGDWVLCGFGN